MKKSVVKGVTKTVLKAVKKPGLKAVKKTLPFQKNCLKAGGSCFPLVKVTIYKLSLLMFGISVSNLKKREIDNVTVSNRPRYDNFLKSGSKYFRRFKH